MIEFDILGRIGLDNSVAARVRTGTSLDHLFLDCGGNCLNAVPWTDIRDSTALFFSHFHFDHFAGIDEILRCVWCREGPLMEIYGPPDTCRIFYHRLQSFLWNNAVGLPGGFRISEFDGKRLKTIRLLTTEKFVQIHEEPDLETTGLIKQTNAFRVEAIVLDHGTPSIGYRISEPDSQRVDKTRMNELGLSAGPWAAALKDDNRGDDEDIAVDGQTFSLGKLRKELVGIAAGDSLGYLTDFRVDDAETRTRLVAMFGGVNTLICENNFRDQEQENARKTFHLTSSEVGQLAAEIDPSQLVLFHVSDRYDDSMLAEQLEQVRQWFPSAAFPENWNIAERSCSVPE